MAFVHCRDCDWGQDDFYSEYGWNPFRAIEDDEEDFFDMLRSSPNDRFISLDGYAVKDNPYLEEERDYQLTGDSTTMVKIQSLVASHFKRIGDRLHKMKWLTMQDFRDDSDPRCPNCNSQNLVVD